MNDRDLAATQAEFMRHIFSETQPLPDRWTRRQAAGLAVYRNAYRARLVDALRDTYERTARWVGEDAFRQAAAHHVITHPPTSWTLDAVGDSFVDTLRDLFANDPEVSELAWLEYAMHRSFTASDDTPLSRQAFSTAGAAFTEDDWAHMRLNFLSGTYALPVTHDIGTLWRALGDAQAQPPSFKTDTALHCVVWREGLKPVFMLVDAAEGTALSMMLAGASYGEACEALMARLGETEAVIQAGRMLGRWLHEGMIAGLGSKEYERKNPTD